MKRQRLPSRLALRGCELDPCARFECAASAKRSQLTVKGDVFVKGDDGAEDGAAQVRDKGAADGEQEENDVHCDVSEGVKEAI